MANEYAERATLREQIGIDDTVEDDAIDLVNESVSRAIDDYCGRRFYADTEVSARVFQATDPVTLHVQDFHDASSVIVETDDNADGVFESTWETTTYQLEPLNADALGRPYRTIMAIDVRIWPTGVWLAGSPFEMASYPTRVKRACVRITAKWGWAAIPPQVKQGHLIQCNRIFKRKDSPFGTAGGPEFGELRMLASRLDPDVQVMLAGLRPGGALSGPSTIGVR